MRIAACNEIGYYEELPLKNSTLIVSQFNIYLKLSVENELLTSIVINGEEIELKETKEMELPCYFTLENSCNVQIQYDKEILYYTFKYNNELAIEYGIYESLGNFHRIVKDYIGHEKLNVDRLIKGIEKGEINLLHIINPFTGLDDNNFLDEVKDAMPFALDICTTPRQHLRIEEEVLDVALVKRINSASLQHLSAHSEHWKGRTISKLIPARMLAQVYEDDLDIYENLFFKMAIDKILLYVASKDAEVRKALAQANNMIEWEQYGNIFKDYRRTEILRKIIPDYNYDEKEFEREEFKELSEELSKLEKILSSIVSTPFYQKINRFKTIPLPVQPTNIIKMDNRYHQLFKLWNKLLMMNHTEINQEGLKGGTIKDLNDYYRLYVQSIWIYALKLMHFKECEEQYIQILEDGSSHIEGVVANDNFEIEYKTVNLGSSLPFIQIEIKEKILYKEAYPKGCHIVEGIELYKDICEIDTYEQGYITFKKKPTKEIEKEIGNLFKKMQLPIKEKNKLDKEWRQFITEVFINFKKPRQYTLKIVPIFSNIGEGEQDLKKYTQQLLEGGMRFDAPNTSTILTLPIDIQKFSKVKVESLIKRLINYGEAYSQEDADKWGDYKVGILPISQLQVNSVQRMIKLVQLHMSKLAIEWDLVKENCPLCHSTNIVQVDDDTWQCKNHLCEVLWGRTNCSQGCHESFYWIRPSIELLSSDINEKNILDQLLKKESIFDSLIITDFDFVIENEKLRYVPKCPKCGMSSVNK